MPSPFRPEEQASIRAALLEAALQHARTTGMKKVSVEDLTREAGISKGSFYHFYDSKEMLFLDMMERFFKQTIERLSETRKRLTALSPEVMSQKLLLEGLRDITGSSLSRFFSEDAPPLLRKLTAEQKSAHLATTDEYLRGLIRSTGIRLSVPEPVAISSIKLLITCAAQNTLPNDDRMGGLDLLAESLCKNIVGA